MGPETVNLHVWPKCNLHCIYCYGTFPDRPVSLTTQEWCRVIDGLAHEGVRRITFSGGEPTLHPGLLDMLVHTRTRGLQTSIITNAAKLTYAMIRHLDVVGITIDSGDDATLRKLGRGFPRGASYLAHITSVVRNVHSANARLKINTVVNTFNADEDMTDCIVSLRPFKWKPLQFVYVPGENDATASSLAIDTATFEGFVARHAGVRDAGIWVAPESAAVIRSTYVMVDPLGRVFQHGPHGHW